MIGLYIALGVILYVICGLIFHRAYYCWYQYVAQNYSYAKSISDWWVTFVIAWWTILLFELVAFTIRNAREGGRPIIEPVRNALDRMFIRIYAYLVGTFGKDEIE